MDKAIRKGLFYIWFDAEYSTLDLETARLLQVAAVITDQSLKRIMPVERDVRLTIRVVPGQHLSPWVEENLSDLVKACHSPDAVDEERADERLAAWVDTAVGLSLSKEQRPILAGNSIHADWWLIRRYLPRFLSRLHYRHLDVTAFKLEWNHFYPDQEFMKEEPENILDFFPEAVIPTTGARHDAYYDVQASIAELAFYRRLLFRPIGSDPG